ncbi:MAG: AAA family ATPase, partial [Deltaproteobacteria bacterium]|nr:AAA family ATPase [Deltaproteobacteria bacterium]
MRALPSQGQPFDKIREKDLLYVDKTKYLYDIVRTEGCFFLSRPRRFGKSLLLGAAHELLQGNREYFKGLWIDSSDYDFKKYPVVHLDMLGNCDSTAALENNISEKLKVEAARIGLDKLTAVTLGGMLSEMVSTLNRTSGERVAVLIDEYDYPIQDVIGDLTQADKNRATLHDFYSSLKSLADRGKTHVILVTGVSKFAQTSLFSAFNNLDDLTMDPRYNAICGFTLEEFEDYFSDYLPEVLEYNTSNGFLPEMTTVADLKKTILDYYDGYSWNGIDRILNPFSLVKMLAKREL